MENTEYSRLQQFGEVVAKLTADREAFKNIVEAYDKQDVERFQAELKRLNIAEYCVLVCRWLCLKRCVIFCRRVCPAPVAPPKVADIEEIREFGEAVVRTIKDKKMLDRLFKAYDEQDVEKFREILEKLELTPFCAQMCHWVCYIRCKRICRLLCPPPPSITHVAYIPTTQIDSEGYATGPSQPPGTTPTPTSCRGHHPFGGLANVRGVFNITTPPPDKYTIEFASNIAGPWQPIMRCITETDYSVWPPVDRTRCPSGPPDPGWYAVADMIDPNYLTDLDTELATGTTGKFYLRLTVKNTAGSSFQSPIVPIRIDNETPTIGSLVPPIEGLTISIKKPDGTEQPLKCGGIKKGEGTLLIRFLAWDDNFRQLTLSARGGCGLNIPIMDETTGSQVSRCYGGNTADKGEPTQRVVEWDPWKDPKIIPCCYNVVLEIWDRAIVNNFFSGGHRNSDWEAVQIALG